MENFSGETPYAIMFGPDICGYSTKRVHVILPYKGDNHLIDHTIPCETDVFTHVYTLAIRPDNSYEVCCCSQHPFLFFIALEPTANF
jgi:calreticulin